MTSKKTRPAEINRELYNEFKKFCIDNNMKKGEALEKAIAEFMEEKNNEK